MRPALLLLLAAVACDAAPTKPAPLQGELSPTATSPEMGAPRIASAMDDRLDVPPIEDGTNTEPPRPVTKSDATTLVGRLSSWEGMPFQEAELCTVEGCVAAGGALAVIELPEGEVTVWAQAPGTVQRHLQLVTGTQAHITVPTFEEADALAASFGVERLAGHGTLIQFVDATWGVAPELSVEAEGPFLLDGRGEPMPEADVVEQGYYVFFNVPPGLHRVELPGCDEGELFWGTPSDEAIDLEMASDAWLGLAPVDCIH